MKIHFFFPFFFSSFFYYINGSSTAPISSSTVLTQNPSNYIASIYSSSSTLILNIQISEINYIIKNPNLLEIYILINMNFYRIKMLKHPMLIWFLRIFFHLTYHIILMLIIHFKLVHKLF